MNLNFLNVYQSKIESISKLLFQYFNQDVLLFFQIHDLKGYKFSQTKRFQSIPTLPNDLKGLHEKKYIEFRFLCRSENIFQTKNHHEFFTHLSKNSEKTLFFLTPYFSPFSQSKNDPNQEDFFYCDFEIEFNLKLYQSTWELELRNKDNNPEIHKIYLQLKEILNSLGVKVNDSQFISTHSNGRVLKDLISENQIRNSINNFKEHMNKGDCYLANVTTTGILKEDKFPTYINFINTWFQLKSRFGVFFDKDKIGLTSYSPERFLLCKNNFLVSEPIKGTRPLGKHKATRQDAKYLWKNKKEIYEHTLVVDLIRNDLNSVCKPESVQVYRPFQLTVAGKLYQMQTTLVGEKEKSVSLASCLSAMLPAGSITGTPKKMVCDLVAKYESVSRGYYTGVCGVQRNNGDFDSCVLIRSLYKGKRGIYWGVGAGITTMSNTEDEIEEFKVKLNSFLIQFCSKKLKREENIISKDEIDS